ncbi:MAG TPA: tRNA (adenosine(37)-N6)-threonylcarbamoyltransferase complex dimerization subunit type 1 TsaB [Acidimicrobiales bacterium]|nr:tRNA (adenosine(37)-N6)-threonylcarbamoyltransferase complex dimerization subunit type 1 TsaB [Acidimicrobiales bacterium]
MLILAVETATESAGVALVDGDGLLAMTVTARRRRHAETVAPSIAFVCDRAGVALADVTALAVDIGPGLFTGLRVGIATVKALALALEVPVVTATSLEILASAAVVADGAVTPDPVGAGGPPLVVPVVDARRGEVFSAVFEVAGSATRRVRDEAVGTPVALAETLRGLERRCLVVGDGALRYRALFDGVPDLLVATDALAHPPVAVLGTLALGRVRGGAATSGDDVTPRYLRDADARIHWEQRAVRPTGSSVSPVGGAA